MIQGMVDASVGRSIEVGENRDRPAEVVKPPVGVVW